MPFEAGRANIKMLKRMIDGYIKSPHHQPAKSLAAGTMVITGYCGACVGLTAGYLGISLGGKEGMLKYATIPAVIGGAFGAGVGSLSYFSWHHSRRRCQILYPHLFLPIIPTTRRICAGAAAGIMVFEVALYAYTGASPAWMFVGCLVN